MSEVVRDSQRVYVGLFLENPLILKLLRARILSRTVLAQGVAVFDMFVLVATGLLAKAIYLTEQPEDLQLGGYYAIVAIAVSIFLVIASQRGEYAAWQLDQIGWRYGSSISNSLAAFSLTFAVLFFFKASSQFSRVWFASWAGSSVILLLLGRAYFAWHLRHL